jgi:hypothetical protein
MKFCLCFLLIFFTSQAFSQDSVAAKRLIKKLASSTFQGRGYTKKGVNRAADFLAFKFSTFGLKPYSKSYLQSFQISVNTFPGKVKLKINDRRLKPGRDYILNPASKSLKREGKLIQKEKRFFTDSSGNFKLFIEPKLTWSVSQKEAGFTEVSIDSARLKTAPLNFKVNVENKLFKDYKTANVAGFVSGTRRPDSILIITAHYDHIGGMGRKTYFPGANDNASGTSMLLELARYYAKNPLPYSVAFICFSAEEAGLLGSKYFIENPLFDLSKVRFLINLDMVGTGQTGITVVNSAALPKEFELLNRINDQRNYLTKINKRGNTQNSDHYWFTEKGVPAFFIYTTGGIKAYHDIYDRAKTLPLTEFQDIGNLIKDFYFELCK